MNIKHILSLNHHFLRNDKSLQQSSVADILDNSGLQLNIKMKIQSLESLGTYFASVSETDAMLHNVIFDTI